MTDRVVVEADGGSRGNPGVAGYGALVRDAHTGRVLVERAAPLGKQSNNVAEYQGLIAGLDAAAEVAPGASVEVKMDSKLVIEQMAGRWKVKHEDMRRLSLEAAAIVRRIRAAGGSVTWTWIPRERNKAADKLSNDGMDGRAIDTLPAALARRGEPETGERPPDPVAPTARVTPATSSTPTSPAPVPPPGGVTRVILVRHGVTDPTAESLFDGPDGVDPGLNRDGRQQAQAVARGVRGLVTGPVRLVTSGLAAARQTGAALAGALGAEPAVDDGWDDREAGLEACVLDAYQRAASSGGTVVVVTSGAPIVVVLGTLLGMPPERFRRLVTDPASVSAVEIQEDGSVSVPFVNRTAHLG